MNLHSLLTLSEPIRIDLYYIEFRQISLQPKKKKKSFAASSFQTSNIII
jgi:hypothetical protein